MRIGVLICSENLASRNIGYNLKRLFFDKSNYFLKHVIDEKEFNDEIILLNYSGSCVDYDGSLDLNSFDVVFFACTHKSEKKLKTLSVHAPGNFNKNTLGGVEKEICLVDPVWLTSSFFSLLEKRDFYNFNDFLVTYEVTHHGPFITNVPVLFIEIGSTEEEWSNEKLGLLVAESILESVKKYYFYKNHANCVGIGGPHYASNFNEVLSSVNIGHIVPKYSLEYLDESMIQKLINRTKNFDFFVVDYKGLGSYKSRVKDLLENFSWKKTKELKLK